MKIPGRPDSPLYSLLPADVEGFDALAELALDLRWTWNHAVDEVWQKLYAELWELTRNPWIVLQTVSRERIKHVLSEAAFRAKVDGLVQAKRNAVKSEGWFQKHHADAALSAIAFFKALDGYRGNRTTEFENRFS